MRFTEKMQAGDDGTAAFSFGNVYMSHLESHRKTDIRISGVETNSSPCDKASKESFIIYLLCCMFVLLKQEKPLLQVSVQHSV